MITGVGRRRRWSLEDKARIVAESLDPATTSSAVARRYGLHASQLFVWRQQLQRSASSAETVRGPGFVPVLLAEDSAPPAEAVGRMEIALGPAVVRVGADVDGRGAAAGARGGAGPGVILVPPGVRILLAAQPVDFRKGMDGLAALVQQALRADPFAGDVFIFRPRRADRVKILVYDRDRPVPVREAASRPGGSAGPRRRTAWCA